MEETGNKIRTHKDLEVWKNSIEFVKEVYKVTSAFPESEKYGLSSQMRRAAVSIPSNIAEGAGRFHTKEYIHFLHISSGSVSELETQIIISSELSFISVDLQNELFNKLNLIRAQLKGLIKFNNSKI